MLESLYKCQVQSLQILVLSTFIVSGCLLLFFFFFFKAMSTSLCSHCLLCSTVLDQILF